MHSLAELSFTTCSPVTLPSLHELTRLATLSIDLLDNDTYEDDPAHDSSCFVEIPDTPTSLRRLRFHNDSSSATLGRPQLDRALCQLLGQDLLLGHRHGFAQLTAKLTLASAPSDLRDQAFLPLVLNLHI
jgi:hypothetical protein